MANHQERDPSAETADAVRIQQALHTGDYDTAAKLILLAASQSIGPLHSA
jgi:hypothetical protein